MGVQVIDGTVENVAPKAIAGGLMIFHGACFTLADGSMMHLPKFVAMRPVARALVRGKQARFYHYECMGLNEIVGVRTPDGKAISHFRRDNEYLALGGMVIGLIGLIPVLLMKDSLPLPVIGLPILLVTYVAIMGIRLRNMRIKAQALFNAG